ncbi:MAG: M15 family metallopeptidase [Thermomicrobiales bacterium]
MMNTPAPPPVRPTCRRKLVALAIAAAALIGGAGATTALPHVISHPALAGRPVTLPVLLAQQAGEPAPPPPPGGPPLDARPGDIARESPGDLPGDLVVGAEDGALPGGVPVFDDNWPGVANLDPALLLALRAAAADAEPDGVTILVTSGWRSPAYQEALVREAVATYGSADEAARWVAAPTASAHVTGDAVDLGPLAATDWLAAHGAAYGLCQTYANEPWHYELRPTAVAEGCPAMAADAAHGPAAAPG